MPETVVHFQIRMPPAMHERLASVARDEKRSLNALIVEFLAKAVEQREVEGPRADAVEQREVEGPRADASAVS